MKNDATEGKASAKIPLDIDSLARLAIFLEGLKLGKGDLLPLGTHTLENLWKVVAYLRGDVRYYVPEKVNKNEAP